MTVRRLAARDLEQVVRTNLERLEPLLFRTQLHRIRASQPELNYTEFEPHSPNSTTPNSSLTARVQLHRMRAIASKNKNKLTQKGKTK